MLNPILCDKQYNGQRQMTCVIAEAMCSVHLSRYIPRRAEQPTQANDCLSYAGATVFVLLWDEQYNGQRQMTGEQRHVVKLYRVSIPNCTTSKVERL